MTHAGVWRAIEDFAANRELSCSGLAKNSGLDPTIFNKSKRWTKHGKPRWPSTHSLAKIFDYAGIGMEEFAQYIARAEQETKANK